MRLECLRQLGAEQASYFFFATFLTTAFFAGFFL